MRKGPLSWLVSWLMAAGLAGCMHEPRVPPDPSVYGVYTGSSPLDGSLREVLRVSAGGRSDLIQCRLTLRQDPATRTPTRYELGCDYGSTSPNRTGLVRHIGTLQRQGPWSIGKGTRADPEAVVFQLRGAMSLLQVDPGILQVLNGDRSLMVGDSGWSHTLNRVEHSERLVDPVLARAQPDLSYPITPLASGPAVFAVFEGRSPCQGIARELRLSVDAACSKARWRITLFHRPDTQAPTTYKVEGSLFRQGAREGTWTVVRGNGTDTDAVVYRLAPAGSDFPLLLLRGDENVVFLLRQDGRPLVGHGDFSYTLNRRTGPT